MVKMFCFIMNFICSRFKFVINKVTSVKNGKKYVRVSLHPKFYVIWWSVCKLTEKFKILTRMSTAS